MSNDSFIHGTTSPFPDISKDASWTTTYSSWKTEPDSRKLASLSSTKSAGPRGLPLPSLSQHPGSKITTKDSESQKAKDHNPWTKIPVYSTEPKKKKKKRNQGSRATIELGNFCLTSPGSPGSHSKFPFLARGQTKEDVKEYNEDSNGVS